jgi:hypothetical protein
VVFLGPRANAVSVPKFHVAVHASHATLQMVTPNFSLQRVNCTVLAALKIYINNNTKQASVG